MNDGANETTTQFPVFFSRDADGPWSAELYIPTTESEAREMAAAIAERGFHSTVNKVTRFPSGCIASEEHVVSHTAKQTAWRQVLEERGVIR